MTALAGKTIVITGASRGIGREIALRAAEDGAQVVIIAKTAQPHEKLTGTIYTVAQEVEAKGGKALPIQVDIRDEEQVRHAIKKVDETFGGIDILVNNASAIWLAPTMDTPLKRYDLMMDVNARATFLCSQMCLPLLRQANNPHILTMSPPINLDKKWFRDHTAYTMSKYAMSMCTFGMAAEFAEDGIAINSLWPRTTIATAAIEYNFPSALLAASRKPRVMADAAYIIFSKASSVTSGNFFIDEEVLREAGVTDFSQYAMTKGMELNLDLYIDE